VIPGELELEPQRHADGAAGTVTCELGIAWARGSRLSGVMLRRELCLITVCEHLQDAVIE
jgi:hypothetical protein